MIKLKSFLPLFILALQSAFAQTKDSTSIVGGGTMYPSKNVLENLKHSKDHTNFVQAVNAADLVNTLQGVGPYTVFAPTNEAFKKLPKGMWEILLRPDQKANLADHIDYHIIAGLYSVKDLSKLVKDN
ncbi:MAG TPA: fasciclin domain-containing protein, partial [Cytophagales bacterium]|nr:fasciclin domain-containing protein [Cytophagales bacterium]